MAERRKWVSVTRALVGGVAAAALICATAVSVHAQCRVFTLDADFDLGLLEGVNYEIVHDQLQLNLTRTTFRFAWIANAEDGTVSKVDTQTGNEVARYYTASPTPGGVFGGGQSPSRTAVDRDGNCWVANRRFGGQSSITQILVDGGFDRDGSTTIETSSDANNNGVIDGAELLAWGADERVVRHYRVGGGSGLARALTLDRTGFVWVGLFNEHRVLKLDPALSMVTYAPLAGGTPPELVTFSTSQTYGLATAPNGRLYLSTLSNRVEELDPGAASGGTDPPRVLQSHTFSGTNYGIAVDGNNIVWMANISANGPIRWDPALGAGGFTYGGGAGSRGRGITVDFDGNVWMACDLVDGAAKYTPAGPPVLMMNTSAGGAIFPIGIGITSDGEVILAGQNSNSWGKVNHITGATIVTGGPQTVGNGPYTYSDFTGSLSSISGQQGFWTVVCDGGLAGFKWGTVSWNSLEPESTSVTVEVRASDDSSAAGLGTQTYMAVGNGVPFTIMGQYIQVRARLTSSRGDLGSPVLYDLTICPGNKPPDCSGAYPSIAELWPPNHNMVDVNVLGVTDPDGDPITITITGVSQDEPTNTVGDGNTCPDASISGGTASVRSERTGNPRVPGNGRVYAISFTASDGNGGTCEGTVGVCVPHDQRPGHVCLDDGQDYNSLTCNTSGVAPVQIFVEVDATIRSAKVNGNEAVIDYSLTTVSDVQMDAFDVLGRKVATLENGSRVAGEHRVSWNTSDLKDGMYFIRLQAGKVVRTRSLLILK